MDHAGIALWRKVEPGRGRHDQGERDSRIKRGDQKRSPDREV